MNTLSRRRVLLGASAIATGLAGCSNGNGEEEAEDPDTPEGRVDLYLSSNEANEYDESIEDLTGSDEVTIEVGGGEEGFAFVPPGARIAAGTTVVWEWTGRGEEHNIVPDEEGDFEDYGQEETIAEEGHTVEHTFEDTGAALYYCEPHRAVGMYGGLVVE